jgi:hypothetical protein
MNYWLCSFPWTATCAMILVCALSETTTFALWKRTHTHTHTLFVFSLCVWFNVHARARLLLVWMRALAHVRAGVHAATHTQHKHCARHWSRVGTRTRRRHCRGGGGGVRRIGIWKTVWCVRVTLQRLALAHCTRTCIWWVTPTRCGVCFCARAFLHAQCWLFLLVVSAGCCCWLLVAGCWLLLLLLLPPLPPLLPLLPLLLLLLPARGGSL